MQFDATSCFCTAEHRKRFQVQLGEDINDRVNAMTGSAGRREEEAANGKIASKHEGK